MKPELTSKLFVELKKKEISKVEPRKSSCHRGVLQQQQAVIYLWNKVSWIQQSDFITQKGKRHRSITFTLISIVHVIRKLGILQRIWQHIQEQIQFIYNPDWRLLQEINSVRLNCSHIDHNANGPCQKKSINFTACQRDPRCRSMSCPCATCKCCTGRGHDSFAELGCISD